MTNELQLRNFIDLSRRELQEILTWRNHIAIRTWMDNQEPITWDQHIRFVQALKDDNQRLYFRVDRGNTGIGVVNLTSIQMSSQSAEIGIYRAVENGMNGDGRKMMMLLEDTARSIGITTLFLKVRIDNTRAISLYENMHYKQYDIDCTYQYRRKGI